MSYTPIDNPPVFDLIYDPVVGEKTYDLSKYPNEPSVTLVPPEAKEVLLYFFVSIRDNKMASGVQRGFYEFITKDGETEYTQYMNVIFTKDDYVMNSENIWVPIGAVKELTVKLTTFSWSTAQYLKKTTTHKSLKEFKENIAKGEINDIYAEFFVIGYR